MAVEIFHYHSNTSVVLRWQWIAVELSQSVGTRYAATRILLWLLIVTEAANPFMQRVLGARPTHRRSNHRLGFKLTWNLARQTDMCVACLFIVQGHAVLCTKRYNIRLHPQQNSKAHTRSLTKNTNKGYWWPFPS